MRLRKLNENAWTGKKTKWPVFIAPVLDVVKQMQSDTVAVELLLRSPKYIHPDMLYMSACKPVTFVYDITSGELYWSVGMGTHGRLISDTPALKELTGGDTRRKTLEDNFCLTGRIGLASASYQSFHKAGVAGYIEPEYEGQKIISFWNDDLHDGDLQECIRSIIKHGLATEKDLISTPENYTYRVFDTNVQKHDLSPEEREKLNILKDKPHELRGDDKKKALEKLGAKPKTRPLSLDPGEKWWAMQSEDIQ